MSVASYVDDEEWITPHRLTIAILIKIATMKEKFWGNIEFYFCLVSAITEPQPCDPSLLHFCQTFQRECTNQFPLIEKNLKKRINTTISCVSKFMDMFESIRELYTPPPGHNPTQPPIDCGSVFGLFLRRLLYSYDMNSFDGICNHFESYQSYCCLFVPSFAEISSSNSPTATTTTTIDGMETYIQIQTNQLPHIIGHTHPITLFRELSRLQGLCQTSSLRHLAASSHLCSSLAMTMRDWFSAVTHSRLYFDAQMEGRDSIPPTDHTKKRTQLDTAILDMARIHIQFGHTTLGVQHLAETLCVAQARNHPLCLAKALSWLLYVDWANLSYHTTQHLQNRSVTFAHEMGLFEFAVKNALHAAQTSLFAYHTNPNLSLPHTALTPTPPTSSNALIDTSKWLTFATHQSIESFLPAATAQCHLATASLWRQCGHHIPALLFTLLPLKYYTQTATCDDMAATLCNMAQTAHESGDREFSESIMDILKSLFPHTLFTVDSIAIKITKLQLQNALISGDSQHALWYCSQLQSNFPLNQHQPTLTADGSDFFLWTSQLFSQLGDCKKSHDLLQFLLGESQNITISKSIQLNCIGTIGPSQVMDFLLTICNNYINAQNCLNALPYALHCLSLTHKYHHPTARISAILSLSRIHFCIGQPERAMSLLEDIALSVTTNCPHSLAAEYYLILAKLESSILHSILHQNSVKDIPSPSLIRHPIMNHPRNSHHPTFSNKKLSHLTTEHRKASYDRIIGSLMKSSELFGRLGCLPRQLDAFHLAAVVSHSVGNIRMRNSFARKFRVCQKLIQRQFEV
jgi:hypothetical protein